MINLQIEALNSEIISETILQQAAEETLKQVGASLDADLTIVLTGDETLRQLNREFMGIDAPTDVLSFPADEIDPETGQPYLGDVVISIPRAQAQAPENGQSVQAEILLLAVHGVLHLLGFDHAEASEKELMWAQQQAVLSRVGTANS